MRALDLVCRADTVEKKHAVIWSVSNMVPLQQFDSSELKVVYYEDLCTQPEIELPGIFEAIGYQYSAPPGTRMNYPSQTARRDSAVVTGANKIENWKKKLSHSQIDHILQVVQSFGLGHLYGDSPLPIHKNSQ